MTCRSASNLNERRHPLYFFPATVVAGKKYYMYAMEEQVTKYEEKIFDIWLMGEFFSPGNFLCNGIYVIHCRLLSGAVALLTSGTDVDVCGPWEL